MAAQNDGMSGADIKKHVLGRGLAVSADSLAGFVVISGRAMTISDTHHLPADAPFKVSREMDSQTGFVANNILAIPLSCPDAEVIGVLELFNLVDAAWDRNDAWSESILSLASTAAVAVHNLLLQEHVREGHLNTILCLSTVAEYRDMDTADHVQRVSRSSELTAAALGLPAQQIELIKYASPMHDVGKVGIPDAILLKPGHLTPERRKAMERHTVIGSEILGEADDPVLVAAQDVALCHHERWDGEGYPRGLSGTSIPLAGRIVGLVDVFERGRVATVLQGGLLAGHRPVDPGPGQRKTLRPGRGAGVPERVGEGS